MRLIDADALGLQCVEKMNELLKARNIPNISEALGLLYGANQIFHAPTADAEPVCHGRWIDECCSICGKYVYHGDAGHYCPNCGAKMDGGKT